MLILWTGSFFNKKDGHFYCKNTGIRRAKRRAKFKFLLKKNKLCAFTQEWVSNQIFKSPAWLNDFLHFKQLCGFSPEWVSKWIFNSPALLNDLLHCKQLCAFSPEWVSNCLFKVPASVNDLLHWAQLCDFSPVWVIKCQVLRLPEWFITLWFSHFGRTENGVLGTRIKILRPLFNTS